MPFQQIRSSTSYKRMRDVRHIHDTRMEYVQKTGRHEITRTMVGKLSRRHFTKLEAMQWKVDTI